MITRYKYIVLAVILAGIVACFYSGCKTIKNLEAELKAAKANEHSFVLKPNKTTAEFSVTKGEFAELFPDKARELDSLKRKANRVQSFQKVIFKYSVDTVLVPVNYPEPSPFSGNVWTFQQGCLDAEISKADTSDMLSMSLKGEVPLFIIVDLYRPKHWFWKLQWNKFNDSTRVETPCGLTIKENVKFNFK